MYVYKLTSVEESEEEDDDEDDEDADIELRIECTPSLSLSLPLPRSHTSAVLFTPRQFSVCLIEVYLRADTCREESRTATVYTTDIHFPRGI